MLLWFISFGMGLEFIVRSLQTNMETVEKFIVMMKTTILVVLACMVVAPQAVMGQGDSSSIGVGKDVVRKWIEARKLISREKADWAEDKVMINESIRVFKSQSESVSTDIEKAEESTARTQTEYDKLKTENEDIISANDKLTELVKDYEKRMVSLVKRLPSTLQERISSLTNKLPEDSEKSKAPITNRMQVVVAILGELEKFQNAITVVNELRKVSSGEELEVQTLYLGLGQAYFVDQSATYAGVGIPGESGWEWKDQPGLGKIIRNVIEQYEESATASFSLLPVEITNKVQATPAE